MKHARPRYDSGYWLFAAIIAAIALLIFTLTSSAQLDSKHLPRDPETGMITFSAVISADSIMKDELYSRAMQWYANTFKSAQAVIQYSDKGEGKIIGKGSFVEYAFGSSGDTRFTITTFFKDGKAKIILTDFSWKVRNPSSHADILNFDSPSNWWINWWPRQIPKLNEQLNTDALATLAAFEKAMKEPAQTEKW